MKNINLTLHCGANRVNVGAIGAVNTPPTTKSYCPINHRILYDLVASSLQSMNMRIVAEEHALGRNGQRYFGLLQIANCQEVSQDYAYVLGIRNSMDKCFPAGLCLGSGVFVCDNLAFSGEISIARKHTTNIMRDLPVLTSRAVGQLSEKWMDMNTRFEAYKTKELVDAQVHDIAIRALDVGAATPQQIPHIISEWRNPRHQEFVSCGKTAWRLFNAFTEIHKATGVFTLPKRTQSLHGLLDAECGIISRTPEAIAAGTEDAVVVVANN